MSRDRRGPVAAHRHKAPGARGVGLASKAARAIVRLTVCALGVAAIVATASARVPAQSQSRDAVVSGYVRVCGGPAPGGCRIETFGICEQGRGCVTSRRVAAINASGQQVAVQRLRHARFHMRLAPGRYTLQLLGGGSRVHHRVMQQKRVTARAYRTVVVRFIFDVP